MNIWDFAHYYEPTLGIRISFDCFFESVEGPISKCGCEPCFEFH